MSYRHGNTYAAHSQFQAAAANYDNAAPYEADSDDLEDAFAEAPASVRADLLWDFIDTPGRKVGHDLRADFMEYVAGREIAETDEVDEAIRLIRRALPWISASGSVRDDLDRALELLGGVSA